MSAHDAFLATLGVMAVVAVILVVLWGVAYVVADYPLVGFPLAVLVIGGLVMACFMLPA